MFMKVFKTNIPHAVKEIHPTMIGLSQSLYKFQISSK